MEIRLKRYYGDAQVTKSRVEVWMQGESTPRICCEEGIEARETAYRDYEESFSGASGYCLPQGRWRMKVGGTPYGAMGLRVVKCAGHRCVSVGWDAVRQSLAGTVLVGRACGFLARTEGTAMQEDGRTEKMAMPEDGRIEDGKSVFRQIEGLVYEAFARGEEFWMVVDNEFIRGEG